MSRAGCVGSTGWRSWAWPSPPELGGVGPKWRRFLYGYVGTDHYLFSIGDHVNVFSRSVVVCICALFPVQKQFIQGANKSLALHSYATDQEVK